MIFKNRIHEKIFLSKRKEFSNNNRTLAAVFILTSDKDLWERMKRNCENGQIVFDGIPLSDFSPEQYALFMAAKDLYIDETHLSITDLADKAVLDNNAFALIMNAICIARCGIKNEKTMEVTK